MSEEDYMAIEAASHSREMATDATIRDYFAVKAMQGYLANPWQAEQLESLGESAGEQMATVAEISYCMADAMLRARGQ